MTFEIYRSMIVPVVTDRGILNLKLSGESEKLAALHERAMLIIGRNSKECSVISPERVNIKRACILVHKIINDSICVALQGHFERHAHKTTRNNNYSVFLPKITTEYARQGFFYMGAKLYSDLPTSVRTAENRKNFMEKLNFF